MPTTLTVIVTFANAEDSLSTTLRSLASHPDDRISYVLVDDGSTDDTPDTLEAFAAGQPRVNVVRQRHRQGFGAARNRGLDEAAGTWIAFLDGDDFVENGYYPRLLDVADDLGCDFVRTDHVRVEGRHREVRTVPSDLRDGTIGDPREAILPLGQATAVESSQVWAGIYHRRLLDRGLLEFRPDLTAHEDIWWMWRLHLKASSFSVAGLRGVFHQAGVGPSATSAIDIVRGLDAMVSEVQADREADRFLPKALFLYASTMAREVRRVDYLDRPRARTLGLLCGESLRALPPTPLALAMERLDRNDTSLIEGLLHE